MDNPTNISIVESVSPLQGIKWRDFLLENEWCNDKKNIWKLLVSQQLSYFSS